MKQMTKITGRQYAPFVYYGAKDATDIIIAMGSINDDIKTVIDKENKAGKKLGLITVHLYRPFSVKYLMDVMPKTVKKICVLDRTKEPGANGDPLYLDVVEAFKDVKKAPMIIGGRYGLSSKDTTPAQVLVTTISMLETEGEVDGTLWADVNGVGAEDHIEGFAADIDGRDDGGAVGCRT